MVDGDVRPGRGDDDIAVKGDAPADSDRSSGWASGVPSASRHARTVRSWPPLTMTGVPSGSAPAATAVTPCMGPRSGSPTGVRSASRHTRTVPSPGLPPLMMTGVPSGSRPTATAHTPPSWPVRTW